MTPEMRQMLDTIRTYYAEKQVSPSVRELAGLLGVKGIQGVHSRLHALIDGGYLIRTPGRDRNYAPVEADRDLSRVPTADLHAELGRRGGKRHA